MAKIWKEYMKAYYVAIPTPSGTLITPSPEEKEEKDPDSKLAKDGDSTPLLLPGLKLSSDEPKAASDAAVAKPADTATPEKPKVDLPAVAPASNPSAAPVTAPTPEPVREAPVVAPEPAVAPAPAPATAPSTSNTSTFIAPATPASRSKYSPYEQKPAFAPGPAETR